MFDVDWTDPSAENVGQRRARKEVKRDHKKKDERRSVRDSVSSRESSSSAEKSQRFLGSLGLKISSASLRGKRLSPNTLQLSADDNASKRLFTLSQPATLAPSVTSPKKDAVVQESKPDVAVPPINKLNLGGTAETSDKSTNRSSKSMSYIGERRIPFYKRVLTTIIRLSSFKVDCYNRPYCAVSRQRHKLRLGWHN